MAQKSAMERNEVGILILKGVKVGFSLIGGDGERVKRREREHAAVACVLEQMLGRRVSVEHKPDGAPWVDGIPYISITHSQRLVAVAIGPDVPIGIDAEEWRTALERVKSRFLTTEELKWCDDLLMAWTIKEAVYKVAGIRTLSGPQIHLSRDYQAATALGVMYRISSFTYGSSRITLAVKS